MIKKIFFLLVLPFAALAHGDDAPAKATGSSAPKYFSAQAVSDNYELLIKYGELQPGKESKFKLFISNFVTNEPVDSAQIQLSVVDNDSIKLTVKQIDKGEYEVTGIFPKKASYNITANINSVLGPDLLLINDIDVGEELNPATAEAVTQSHWYSSNWFFGIIGLLIGLIIMFFIQRKTNRKVAAAILLLLILFPTATYNTAWAHGDDASAGKGGALSNTFIIEKETQFLFNIGTQKIATGDFNQATQVLGTVVPSPQGRAMVQSPQTGKIVSLNVSVGQRVSAGQTLAVVEQQVDAGTQINILSQKNSVDAEFIAAKAQYDRLKSIADIAAKKDVTEAQARYEAALRNKELFNSNVGRSTGNTRMITLTAPISGVVGTFNYAIGAVINAGETIFDITNLDKVMVEAQVFNNDAAQFQNAEKVTTNSTLSSDTAEYRLRLVSTAQSVNGSNQSQKVIFEILNPKGQFKIGENINVSIFSKNSTKQILVPDDAVAEVNGKPVVFVKDKAEQYSISYVNKGASNGKYTVIVKGAEEGERIVTNNVYQMKTIYLNQ